MRKGIWGKKKRRKEKEKEKEKEEEKGKKKKKKIKPVRLLPRTRWRSAFREWLSAFIRGTSGRFCPKSIVEFKSLPLQKFP